jgi:hypothetical protein
VLSPFLHRISQHILPAPVPALLDEFLIPIQTVWQTDVLHAARAHIAAMDHANALRLPLNLHHGAVETGLRYTLIGGNTDISTLQRNKRKRGGMEVSEK